MHGHQRVYLTNAKRDHTFNHARENLGCDLLGEYQWLDNHHLPTITKACAPRRAEAQHTFLLATVNARSLRLYAPDVVHDASLRLVYLSCLCETWSNFFVQVDSYTGVACDHCVDS